MDDIKLFKTTLMARRFPGLRDLNDEDIRALIAADQKATGRVLQDPRNQRTHPKTQYAIPPHKRDTLQASTQAPFSPINPEQAKETIRRPHSEGHLGEGNPYDGDTTMYLEDKHSDENKRDPAPWQPTCPAQAKHTIVVDVYMNSADAEMKAAQRDSLRSKALSNTQQFHELTTARRGKMLV